MSLRRSSKLAVALVGLLMLAPVACSSDSDGSDGSDGASGGKAGGSTGPADGSEAGSTTTTEVDRPDGPAAVIDGPLSGGRGLNQAVTVGPDLEEAGWVVEEFSAAGTAVRYTADGDLPTDGEWTLTEGEEADYRTRIVVRRPSDSDEFNGTVVVEWLNVSGGLDAAPDYSYMSDELLRGGYAHVSVSAQHIGIEGGPTAVSVPAAEGAGAGQGIKAADPERYGDLTHPGDAFSYDIFTQVARALRGTGDDSESGESDGDGASSGSGVDPLGDLEPERLLAVGESQSGFALTSYANGVQPLTRAFDGILIHSRGGAAAPLGEPGEGIDIASTLGGEPTKVRTDLDAPVLIVQSESDVLGILGYEPARQDDTDSIRLWEVAGTAHADRYLLEPIVETLGCPGPINDGPQHFVIKAALRALDRWVADGEAPPEAERLEIEDGAYVTDENGNVRGGVRTPLVDVPVDVLSGEAPEGATAACLLSGSTEPLPDDRLAELYPSRDDYVEAYEAAADEAIDAGFVLDDDRDALIDASSPDRIPG